MAKHKSAIHRQFTVTKGFLLMTRLAHILSNVSCNKHHLQIE